MNSFWIEGQGQQPIYKYVCHNRDKGVHNKGSKARPCHYTQSRRWAEVTKKKRKFVPGKGRR